MRDPVWVLGMLAVVAGFSACGRTGTVPSAPAAAAVVSAPPAEVREGIYFAVFRDEQLSECVSFIGTRPPGAAPRTPEETQKHGEEIAAEATKMNAIVIPRPCNEQFADRVPLATCTLPEERFENGGKLQVVGAHYDYERVGNSDQYMRECMEDGGSWNALPRDSDEFLRGRMRHNALKAAKAGERLERMLRNR